MTKLKKTYCILSLIFAIAVFVAVLFASQNRTTVYAASMDPDSIDSLDNTAANTSTGSGSESDSKGGLSISINNDEAGDGNISIIQWLDCILIDLLKRRPHDKKCQKQCQSNQNLVWRCRLCSNCRS